MIAGAGNDALLKWTRLLETAILAPSPHNVQPWAVRVFDDTTATLFIDLHRSLPKEDLTGSFLISAMGMFLETIAIAANDERMRLDYELVCDLPSLPPCLRAIDELLPFATLRLSGDPAVRHQFTPATVAARSTARSAYDGEAVADASLERLASVAAAHALTFGFTQDEAIIRAIVDANIDALFHDLNDPNYHGEIAQWFRCGDREERQHRDGLSARCMSMSAVELSVAKNFPAPLMIPGIRDVARAYYRRALATPCIGWLTGAFWDPAGALGCGHALMNFWLAVAELGLSIHPLGNLVTNHDAATRIERITGAKDLWFIFKLGRARNVPKSLRRPVEAFLR